MLILVVAILFYDPLTAYKTWQQSPTSETSFELRFAYWQINK